MRRALLFVATALAAAAIPAAASAQQSCAKLTPVSPGATYYVATAADGGNDGRTCSTTSEQAPFATIGKAVSCAAAGDTVLVKTGVYGGRVVISGKNGTADRWITIKAYPGHKPVLDGQGAVRDWNGIVQLDSVSFVLFSGFEVRNTGEVTDSSGKVLTGAGGGYCVRADNIKNVVFQGNTIHDCWHHALIMQGAVNALADGNEMYDLAKRNLNGRGQGWDGGTATNGAFTNQCVSWTNNHIHDVWGECLDPINSDTGVIVNNRVHDCWSANIYLDSSQYYRVDGNYSYTTVDTYNRTDSGQRAAGIKLAKELTYGKALLGHTLSNNVIDGTSAGIEYWAGYDSSSADVYGDLLIAHNLIRNTRSGGITFVAPNANVTRANALVNNIVYGGTALKLRTDDTENGGTRTLLWTVQNNFFPSGRPPDYNVDATNVVSVDPQVTGATLGTKDSYKLSSTSPAIRAGTGAYAAKVPADAWNVIRSTTNPSVGPDEHASTPPPPPPPPPGPDAGTTTPPDSGTTTPPDSGTTTPPDAGNATPPDAGTPACVPQNELCDGQDNDCDGVVDDGCLAAGTTRELNAPFAFSVTGELPRDARNPVGYARTADATWGFIADNTVESVQLGFSRVDAERDRDGLTVGSTQVTGALSGCTDVAPCWLPATPAALGATPLAMRWVSDQSVSATGVDANAIAVKVNPARPVAQWPLALGQAYDGALLFPHDDVYATVELPANQPAYLHLVTGFGAGGENFDLFASEAVQYPHTCAESAFCGASTSGLGETVYVPAAPVARKLNLTISAAAGAGRFRFFAQTVKGSMDKGELRVATESPAESGALGWLEDGVVSALEVLLEATDGQYDAAKTVSVANGDTCFSCNDVVARATNTLSDDLPACTATRVGGGVFGKWVEVADGAWKGQGAWEDRGALCQAVDGELLGVTLAHELAKTQFGMPDEYASPAEDGTGARCGHSLMMSPLLAAATHTADFCTAHDHGTAVPDGATNMSPVPMWQHVSGLIGATAPEKTADFTPFKRWSERIRLGDADYLKLQTRDAEVSR